jgi:hypothetical protein
MKQAKCRLTFNRIRFGLLQQVELFISTAVKTSNATDLYL